MNPFAAIEDACATFVERTFARIFPNDVAPAQIARKLVATMESSPADTLLVRLHPRDVAGLGEDRAYLEGEWSALLARTAATLGHATGRSVRVVVHADDGVVAGTVAIDPIIDDDEAAASARGYVVRVERGLPLEARYSIAQTVTVGRGPENTVDLVDPRASRKHARLTRTDDGILLEDAGSTNGTFVNGGRIAGPVRVAAGDLIVVGDTALRVEVGDG